MEKNAMETLENAERQFVEKIADNMHTFGLPATVGRVLGTIYMNRNPMTLNELSEAIGMSKTRMSQVVREMMEYQIADKVYEKGVRKDLYTVEEDYYQTFISLFTSNWRKAIHKNRMFEQKIDRELAEIQDDQSLDAEAMEKLNEILAEKKEWLAYHDWINRVTEFFESGEIFKYVPKSEEES
ncbi:MAG TPA: GbsR/MarR family transcriptional regulator [Bacillales bacterium]|nr:GbsR/MarR family transcriptional regulator [Bacillales bacterium]